MVSAEAMSILREVPNSLLSQLHEHLAEGGGD